jgi:hypothetical protein
MVMMEILLGMDVSGCESGRGTAHENDAATAQAMYLRRADCDAATKHNAERQQQA